MTYEEAVKFAHRFGLAGIIEVSSKKDLELKEPNCNREEFQSINDCFYISAVNCIDRQEIFEKLKEKNNSKGNNLKGLFSDSNSSQ